MVSLMACACGMDACNAPGVMSHFLPLLPASFAFVAVDSIVVRLFAEISLAVAQGLQLERTYWCRTAEHRCPAGQRRSMT
jgi:hypothetical protein